MPWVSGTIKNEEDLCPDKGDLETRTKESSKELCGLLLLSSQVLTPLAIGV